MVVSRHQPFCVVFRKNGKLSVVYLYFLNALLTGYFCMLFYRLLIFFKINFFENWNTIRVSNSLDPDQALCYIGPDLGSNCLQKL